MNTGPRDRRFINQENRQFSPVLGAFAAASVKGVTDDFNAIIQKIFGNTLVRDRTVGFPVQSRLEAPGLIR